MQQTSEAAGLTSAFQTALGTLATNVTLTRRVVSGEVTTADLGITLDAAEHRALELLLATQADRVLVVAEIMTGRRRRKAELRLPATRQCLGEERFELYWQEYLGAGIQLGSPSAYAEATSLTGWILCRIDSRSFEAQVARFEGCLNSVIDKLYARMGDDAPLQPEVPLEECVLKACELVRMERFDCAVQHAMRTFAKTQQLVAPETDGPTELLFHPAPGKLPYASVTPLLPGMKIILERASGGIRASVLLQATPAHQRDHVRQVVEKLISLRVLVASAGCDHDISR